jgi:ribosomal protein L3 glutamine methyltransferase
VDQQKSMAEQLNLLAAEAVNELQTVNDFLRWGVSRFNESDLYFGHGTDNPWDECQLLICASLNLEPGLTPDILSAKLTTTEKQHIVALIVERIETKKTGSVPN